MNFEQQQKKSILDQIMADRLTQTGDTFDAEALITSLLNILAERERNILVRRFGLFNNEETTLETLGQEYDVTRERIRQIERQALLRLHGHLESDTSWEGVRDMVLAVLEKHGGLMHDEHLLDELIAAYHTMAEGANVPTLRRAIRFIVDVVLREHVLSSQPTDNLLPGWRHPVTEVSRHEEAIRQLEQFFQQHNQVVPFAELMQEHAPKVMTAFSPEEQTEHRLKALVTIAKNIDQNVFGEIGMNSWPMIRPRRMGDKSYLVLRKIGQPLHFRDITGKINEFNFDHKKAFAETIHNELITDERFILVGRGIYALKEWGYTPGVVSDVIEAILKEQGGALVKDAIIHEVLKQRLVKPETVYLALTNKKRFMRLPDGRYVLANQSATNEE